MNVYFDTSAVVPLVLNEVHTPAARTVWEQTTQVPDAQLLTFDTEMVAAARQLGLALHAASRSP